MQGNPLGNKDGAEKGPRMIRKAIRWDTSFGSFVKSYTAAALARDLGLAEGGPAVYHWLAGRTQPRPPTAQRIAELSDGLVTVPDIYRHREEVRGDGTHGGADRSGAMAPGA